MYILSHAPKLDAFFIGLSLEEFEEVSQKFNIDYGYRSNYETTKASAMKEYSSGENAKKAMKDFYGTEYVPFVCIVTNRDCSRMIVVPKHYPYANLWNAYSPWQGITVEKIESLNLENIRIKYTYFSDLLKSFCDEWIGKFSDTNRNKNLYHYSFCNYCKSFGWIADNGESFQKQYKCYSYSDALKWIPQVTDINLLGNLICSCWQYFQTLEESTVKILDNKNWFIEAFTKLKTLA